MNDLDLIQRFRADVPAPDEDRTHAARASLMAEVRSADAHTEGWRDRGRRLRHRPRPALALRVGLPGAMSVVAAAAVAIILLGNGVSPSLTSTADAAIIQHAGAVFALPPHEIFHSKLQGDGFVAESWQLTSAPYSYVEGKGTLGAVPYSSDDGTTAASYDPTTNTIHQTPSTQLPAPNNPVTEIRQDLQNGRARLLRTATIDGTESYEIQLADRSGFDPQSLIVYVEKGSYRPVEITDPQRNGTVVDLHVAAFEYLPSTRAHLHLLSLTARYPSARVVNDSGAAATASGK